MNRADQLQVSAETELALHSPSCSGGSHRHRRTIYRSIQRRRERLETRLTEERLLNRGADAWLDMQADTLRSMDVEDPDTFYDEAPAAEVEEMRKSG